MGFERVSGKIVGLGLWCLAAMFPADVFEYLVLSWWCCLGRFGDTGLLKEVCHWRRPLRAF